MTAYDAWDREYQENKQDYLDVFDRFMSQMNYENNEDFERSFAERIGRKYCVSVASATDALHFTLLAHGIGAGEEVLVTDFSLLLVNTNRGFNPNHQLLRSNVDFQITSPDKKHTQERVKKEVWAHKSSRLLEWHRLGRSD